MILVGSARIGSSPGHRGFTMVEMLVATTILVVIMGIIFQITQQVSTVWKRCTTQIEAFQAARNSFDVITATLGNATLNTYYDYRYNSFSGEVEGYVRKSDLCLVSGKGLVPDQMTHSIFFQTTLGVSNNSRYKHMESLLNVCGFYVKYDKDLLRPTFLDKLSKPFPHQYRYRLMQFIQPSESLAIYDKVRGANNLWLSKPFEESHPPVRELAENIVALIVLPRLASSDGSAGAPLTRNYQYDTRPVPGSSTPPQVTENQLPPTIEVVLVAVDEASIVRLGESETPPEIGLNDGFFQDALKLDEDVKRFGENLTQRKISYRIFRTVISLKNSKWSPL